MAFLTFPRIEMPIQTINDLLARGQDDGMSWGLVKDSIIEQYLRVCEE